MNRLYCYILLLFVNPALVHGQSKLNRLDDSGRKLGLWITLDDSGSLTSASYYSAGVPDGLFLNFNSKGEIIADTLFDSGNIIQWNSLFKDTLKPYEFDAFGKPLTGYLTPFLNVDNSENFYLMKDGYMNGISKVNLESIGRQEINILYKDQLVYMILFDNQKTPAAYYANLWWNRPYQINKCMTNGKTLTIEFENNSANCILIPSLRPRTLMYVRGKGNLFHELYDIVQDTLFVNLNHYNPTNRFFTEHHVGSRHIEKRRVNFRWHQFMEKELDPHDKLKEEVKIYTHGVYIAWIVLIIEDKRYIFRNYDWAQEKPCMIKD